MEIFDRENNNQKEKDIQTSRTYENMFSSDTYRKKASDTLQKIENMQKNIHQTPNAIQENSQVASKPKRTESLLFQKIRERELQEQAEKNATKVNEVVPDNQILNEENQTNAEDADINSEPITEQLDEQNVQDSNVAQEDVNIKHLSEILEDTKINQTNKPPIKPQKNYSFRIKLACGVYVILVALFGGWIISNAVDIKNTSSQIVETIEANTQYEADIAGLVKSINNLNKANENDPSLEVSIITNTIEITPKPLEEPTQITSSSNWFDAICNWISKLFGG